MERIGVADVSEEDPVAVVADCSDGRKADAVFVAASTKSAGESAMQMVGTRGQVIFFAGTHPPERLDVPWNLLHDREVSLLGSVGKSEEDFREAVALLSNGLINVRPLVTRIISLQELDWELSKHPCGPVQRVCSPPGTVPEEDAMPLGPDVFLHPRMRRIFRTDGKALIVAMDHGNFMNVKPSA